MPATDPNNPLGLTVGAPGYLPPGSTPMIDPDLNISGGLTSSQTAGQAAQLTPDQQNAITAAEQGWGNMDQAYWSPREQQVGPLILGALGAIAAPFALSALGIGAGAAAGGADAGASAATDALSAAGGADAGASAATDALSAVGGAGDIAATTTPSVLGGALTAGGAGAGVPVSEVVVTAAAAGSTNPEIAAATGLSAGEIGSILNTANVPIPVSPVTVTPSTPPASQGTPIPLATAPSVAPLTLPDVATPPSTSIVNSDTPPSAPNNLTGLVVPAGVLGTAATIADLGGTSATPPSNSGLPTGVIPALAAGIPALVKALTPSPTAPDGISGAGTPADLNPIFSGTLPSPTNAPITENALPNIDWNRYSIDGPEQSFFSNVPQPGPAQFSVPSTAQNLATGITGLKYPGLAGGTPLAVAPPISTDQTALSGATPAQALAAQQLAAAQPAPVSQTSGEQAATLQTIMGQALSQLAVTPPASMQTATATPQVSVTPPSSSATSPHTEYDSSGNSYVVPNWTAQPQDPQFNSAGQTLETPDQITQAASAGAYDRSQANAAGQAYLAAQAAGQIGPNGQLPPALIAQYGQYLLNDTPNGTPSPVGPITMARGGRMAYAQGGPTDRQNFAVKGPGTGRSDSIPAKLSDGEYVMDAETVSMLGDGSNDAGARKLDKLRVNLRKAKGKELSRGRFSVSAKDPEAYYRGGRTDV